MEGIDPPLRCTIKLPLNTFPLKIIDAVTHLAWKPSWQSLLHNGTVNNHYPSANSDTGTIYGMCSIRGVYWQSEAPLICARRLLLSESGERARRDGTNEIFQGHYEDQHECIAPGSEIGCSGMSQFMGIFQLIHALVVVQVNLIVSIRTEMK